MGKLKTVAEANGTTSGKKGQPELTSDVYRELLHVVSLAAELANSIASKPTVDRNSQLALEIRDVISKLERKHKVKIK